MPSATIPALYRLDKASLTMPLLDQMRAQLNTETAKTDWSELEKFFAKGMLIKVATGLDLVEVAAHIACDKSAEVQAWMTTGKLVRLSDTVATDWHERRPAIWTVVVAPWILVQERAH
jgi:hypothetical protein